MDLDTFLDRAIDRDVRVWSIAGFFEQKDISGGIVPFGGYLFQDRFLGNKIECGELIDGFGRSHVSGYITPDIQFDFVKRYNNNPENNYFNYSFKKEGNLYIGNYIGKGINESIHGNSICVIQSLKR